MSEEINMIDRQLRIKSWEENYPGPETSHSAWATGFKDACKIKNNQLAQQKALLDEKDDDIKFLKFKISEFLGLVADIHKCDKASADRINLWIDGNRAFLEKVKK